MSSTETLVIAYLGLSAGRCWFSTNRLLLLYRYPTSLAGTVSIGASSPPAVEWEVSRRRLLAICFVSAFRFRLALFPFTQAGSFSTLLKHHPFRVRLGVRHFPAKFLNLVGRQTAGQQSYP